MQSISRTTVYSNDKKAYPKRPRGEKRFSPLPSDDKIPSLPRLIVRRQYNTLRASNRSNLAIFLSTRIAIMCKSRYECDDELVD